MSDDGTPEGPSCPRSSFAPSSGGSGGKPSVINRRTRTSVPAATNPIPRLRPRFIVRSQDRSETPTSGTAHTVSGATSKDPRGRCRTQRIFTRPLGPVLGMMRRVALCSQYVRGVGWVASQTREEFRRW
jgi:hypothetical protein